MLKHTLLLTLLLTLLGSCNTQSFGPGLYGDAGMTASTPNQDGYVCGLLRLIHDNIENEHLTFDFGDVLMDVGLSDEKVIDGSWSYLNPSKSEINLTYSYDGKYYNENYEIIEPSSDNDYYILKLNKASENSFELYLTFFEAQ